jgi:hypothetical protein
VRRNCREKDDARQLKTQDKPGVSLKGLLAKATDSLGIKGDKRVPVEAEKEVRQPVPARSTNALDGAAFEDIPEHTMFNR